MKKLLILIITSFTFIGCERPRLENNLAKYEGWVVVRNYSTNYSNYLKIYKPLTDSIQEMIVDEYFIEKFQPNDTITFKK